MAQAQLKATEESERLFNLADVIFTLIFCVELLINMFGTMVNEFVSDWWNWFDVLIVTTSVVNLFLSTSGASLVRLFRNLRGKEIAALSLLFSPGSSCGNVTFENGQCLGSSSALPVSAAFLQVCNSYAKHPRCAVKCSELTFVFSHSPCPLDGSGDASVFDSIARQLYLCHCRHRLLQYGGP